MPILVISHFLLSGNNSSSICFLTTDSKISTEYGLWMVVSHSFTLYSCFLPSLNEYSFSSEWTTTYPGRSFLGFKPLSALARSFAILSKLSFRLRWWAHSACSFSRASFHAAIVWLALRLFSPTVSFAFLSASPIS